jgi:hypothetical protein
VGELDPRQVPQHGTMRMQGAFGGTGGAGGVNDEGRILRPGVYGLKIRGSFMYFLIRHNAAAHRPRGPSGPLCSRMLDAFLQLVSYRLIQ